MDGRGGRLGLGNSGDKVEIHHSIARSRGGTDEEWNLCSLSPYDHAEQHAIDFVLFDNAPWFDCRMSGWELLPDLLREAVLQKMSNTRQGSCLPQETCQKIAESAKKLHLEPGFKKRHREAVINSYKDGARRQERREVMLKICADKEFLQKRIKTQKTSIASSEKFKLANQALNSANWVDPDHPELGAHHFNTLKKLQKLRGLPNGKENRVRLQ
jgi:hypothetical protein